MKREQILYYSLKYHGDYYRIKQALTNEEWWEPIQLSYSYITVVDDCYPESLKQLKQPPWLLYYEGDILLLNQAMVAVVGSRHPIPYAISQTTKLCLSLSNKYVIVSGMAIGIDTIAHQSAMYQGKTIAVLGCGINVIYPKCNRDLYQEIKEKHLIISEYPPNERPQKHYFIARNRIIAGLGQFLVVTAAAAKSGTLSTTDFALELNKEIYALPYNRDILTGVGCNQLIAQGATMILDD